MLEAKVRTKMNGIHPFPQDQVHFIDGRIQRALNPLIQQANVHFQSVNAQFATVNAQFETVNAQFETVNAQFATVNDQLNEV